MYLFLSRKGGKMDWGFFEDHGNLEGFYNYRLYGEQHIQQAGGQFNECSYSPYIEEVTLPAPAQTTPQTGPTEESVRAVIQGLRELYPSLSTYPTPYRSTSSGPYSRGVHCSGWATLCSDAAFGSLPWRRVSSPCWDQIRIGDLVRYNTESSGHVVVVVDKTDEYIKVTESGNTNMVRWGGQYFRWWLEEQPGYTLYTRYPN